MSRTISGRRLQQTPSGMTVGSPGGRAGWLMRKVSPSAATRLYLGWIRLTRARAIRRYIAAFAAGTAEPWFSHVEIETINRCNGSCGFCPVGAGRDTRPYAAMREELFASVISQLAAMNYSGYLGLFSNNEPLLDSRLEEFAVRARAALPLAFMNLSTNGTILTVDRFRRLMPLFDHVVINNYHTRPEMLPPVRKVHDFCLTPEGERLLAGRRLHISLRCRDDVLTSRAGASPNCPAPAAPLAVPCQLPFTQLIVRPDGAVSLCCNDALGGMTLGNLAEQPVGAVWRGEAFRAVRRAMQTAGRAGLPLCRVCDFVKHNG